MKRRFQRSPVTILLLVVIAVVFVIERKVGALEDEERLVLLGAVVPGTIYFGQYWRLVAAMFLHANTLHWASNSFALLQLGMLFEQLFGTPRFIFVYLAAGLCSTASSSMLTHGPSVGASGAIFGILGATISSLRVSKWRKEVWSINLQMQLVFWAAVNLALGLYVPNIDNVAHIAGLLTGVAIGYLPLRQPPDPPSRAVIDVQPYEG